MTVPFDKDYFELILNDNKLDENTYILPLQNELINTSQEDILNFINKYKPSEKNPKKRTKKRKQNSDTDTNTNTNTKKIYKSESYIRTRTKTKTGNIYNTDYIHMINTRQRTRQITKPINNYNTSGKKKYIIVPNSKKRRLDDNDKQNMDKKLPVSLSTSIQSSNLQVNKYKETIRDLQNEIVLLKEKNRKISNQLSEKKKMDKNINLSISNSHLKKLQNNYKNKNSMLNYN